MDKFIKELGLHIFMKYKTQTKYAERLGISKAMVSAVLRGDRLPTQGMLDELGYKMEKTISVIKK